MQAALQENGILAANLEATEVVQVLQTVVRAAIEKAAIAEHQLQNVVEAAEKSAAAKHQLEKKRNSAGILQDNPEHTHKREAAAEHKAAKQKREAATAERKQEHKHNRAKADSKPRSQTQHKARVVPCGEFDVEAFQQIPHGERTEWQQQVVADADAAACAYEAEVAAYLEAKRREDAADLAWLAAQDRAELIRDICLLLSLAIVICVFLIVAYNALSLVYSYIS